MRPFPREPVFLAASPKRAIPEPYHVAKERSDRRAVRGNRVIGEATSDDLPQSTSPDRGSADTCACAAPS